VKLAAAAVVLLLAAGYLATLRAPWQSSGSSALRDQALQNLWRARPQAANAADLAQLRQDLDPATQHALEGIMAINQGDQAAARTALERAIAMSPSHSLASLGLARIEWAGGDATKAKGALQQVLSGGDASTWEKAEALRLLGQISSAGGETSQALDYYRQASDLQGEDSWLLAEKGVLLEKDGNYQAALAAYEEAARRSPEDQFVLSLRKACAEHIRKKEDQEWAQEIRSSLDRLREKLAAPSRPAGETDPWTSRPLGIAALNLAAEGMPPSRLGEEKGLLLALEQEFMQTDRWFIVERERLEAVLQELEIGSSELADSKYSMEVGRFLAARFLLAGTVFRGGPESRISLRLIDTETRRVAAVAEKSCTGELMAAAEDLTSQLSARLAKGYALRGRIESTTGTIVLNIGSLHGVRPGQRFEVFSKETNPRSSSSVTGLSSIGEIEVKTVGESDAACEKTQSDADLQAGMRVQEKGINPPASSS
jgi:tetratricopeptide (TPR) repeat protein